jgi:hypothetical protein
VFLIYFLAQIEPHSRYNFKYSVTLASQWWFTTSIKLLTRWLQHDLSQVVESYKDPFILALQVKNGISRESQGEAAKQVQDSTEYIRSTFGNRVPVCGGLMYVLNKDVDPAVVPRGVDSVFYSPAYNSEELTRAAELALVYTRIDGAHFTRPQRRLLKKIKDLSNRLKPKISLPSLFNPYQKHYWRNVARDHFGSSGGDKYKDGTAFRRDFTPIRGLVMEMYAACAVESAGGQPTSLHLRMPYVSRERGQSDVDLVIVTPQNQFRKLITGLNELGVQYYPSREFRKLTKQSGRHRRVA